MSALILDGGSRAAVESVQSLGRAGVTVDVAAESSNALAFLSRYPRLKLLQPAETSALLRWVRERDAEADYRLIVPATEGSLQAFRGLSVDDPLRRKAVLPEPEALEIALDKSRTWSFARSLHVPVPESRLLRTLADAGEPSALPTVLKPLRSVIEQGGVIVRLSPAVVRDHSEWRRQLARLLPRTPVQEQTYIPGIGVGVECLYAHGRMVWYFMHERIHELPLTGGGSSYRCAVAPRAELIAAAKRLLDTLRWHGVAMVEFKQARNGQFFLMEINPRLWGSLALAVDAGVDFPLGLWRIAAGEPPGPQPHYRVPYYTRDLSSDVEWVKENLRADHSDPLLLTRPRWRSLLEPLRLLLGRESWDHFDWRDLGVARAQIAAVARSNLRGIRSRLDTWRLARQIRRRHRLLVKELKAGRSAVRRILFLCHGNICRSAFAEAWASRRLGAVTVESAGFHPNSGRSPPEHLMAAAAKLAVDLQGHRSRCVSKESVEGADLVLLMDLNNYRELLDRFPQVRRKATLLGLFHPQRWLEIDDPYLMDAVEAGRVLVRIRDSVDALASLLSGGRSGCNP